MYTQSIISLQHFVCRAMHTGQISDVALGVNVSLGYIKDTKYLFNMSLVYGVRMTNNLSVLHPVHTGPDPYGHHINLKRLKTSMTLKFVIILQNIIIAYHRKSGKSKYDRKMTKLYRCRDHTDPVPCERMFCVNSKSSSAS